MTERKGGICAYTITQNSKPTDEQEHHIADNGASKLDAYAEEKDSCPSRVIEGLLEEHWKDVGYRWELDDDDDTG